MIPSKTEIAQESLRGRNCAQITLGRYAEAAGYDVEETDRFTYCFGGGMGMGHTCGAVSGALMAIGLNSESRAEAEEKAAEFRRRFAEKNGSCMCRELLGYDFAVEGQKQAAKESGKMGELCPGFMHDALEILEDIIG